MKYIIQLPIKYISLYFPTFVTGSLLGIVTYALYHTYGAIIISEIEKYEINLTLFIIAGGIGTIFLRALTTTITYTNDDNEDTKEKEPHEHEYDEKSIIDVWKHVVQVQMHFNEMVMRVRNFGLTLVIATVGAAALALERELEVKIFETEILVSSIIITVGLIGWLAFYSLDRWYYHMLLVGAVVKGRDIEKKFKNRLPFLNLGSTITKFSRVRLRWLPDDDIILARHKLDIFYFGIAALLSSFVFILTT